VKGKSQKGKRWILRRERWEGHTTICNPDPTSLIARASSVYPRVEKYLNHRRTGGIWAIFTKNLIYQLSLSLSLEVLSMRRRNRFKKDKREGHTQHKSLRIDYRVKITVWQFLHDGINKLIRNSVYQHFPSLCRRSPMEGEEGGHTKRTIAIENSTIINKNLKNLAAFGARPTTNY
jgi:hypothetical protein